MGRRRKGIREQEVDDVEADRILYMWEWKIVTCTVDVVESGYGMR
jgi:hypothetical protein